MFVLIAGGGRTAAQLAQHLVAEHHEVRLAEHRRDVLVHIHRELPSEIIFEGNAVEPETLRLAGGERADVVVGCLPADADNLALCYLARDLFGVPRTIATVNNPRNAWLFDARFHVDVALNQADILASLIGQEMTLGDMMTLAKLRRGRYSLVGEVIPKGAPAVGVAIKDLPLPPQTVVAAVIRGGEIVIPRGPLQFQEGDEVLAIADETGADELARLFGNANGAPHR
jgi:trk system potassium uptake protein TrkA